MGASRETFLIERHVLNEKKDAVHQDFRQCSPLWRQQDITLIDDECQASPWKIVNLHFNELFLALSCFLKRSFLKVKS